MSQNSITPEQKEYSVDLGGMMKHVEAVMQRFNSEIVSPIVTDVAALKKLAKASGYTTCSTAAATPAKTAALTGYELESPGLVAVKFSNGISVASATLNINSKGAKAIFYGGAALAADVVLAGDTVTMLYDGTQYQIIAIDQAEETYEQIYVEVASPSGNPSTQGWYELSSGSYVATADTTVVSGKTYYFQTEAYSEIE